MLPLSLRMEVVITYDDVVGDVAAQRIQEDADQQKEEILAERVHAAVKRRSTREHIRELYGGQRSKNTVRKRLALRRGPAQFNKIAQRIKGLKDTIPILVCLTR